MSALTTRRWSDRQTVWFSVDGVGPELAAAAPRLLMDYERVGTQWRRGYPSGTPHLEQAWRNFDRYIETMLRQAARLEPVPWREALREVCRRTTGLSVDWWLTGSAALAIRGAPIDPGDLDLVCGARDAVVLGDLFRAEMLEPVMPAGQEWISDWWGRAFLGARIEWIGGVRPSADRPLPSDFGPVAATQLETVTFENWSIRVPPLDLQKAVSQRRGLADRVAMIEALGD